MEGGGAIGLCQVNPRAGDAGKRIFGTGIILQAQETLGGLQVQTRSNVGLPLLMTLCCLSQELLGCSVSWLLRFCRR